MRRLDDSRSISLRVLSACEKHPDTNEWQNLKSQSQLAPALGDERRKLFAQSAAGYEKALISFQKLDIDLGIADCWISLARIASFRKDYMISEKLLNKAIFLLEHSRQQKDTTTVTGMRELQVAALGCLQDVRKRRVRSMTLNLLAKSCNLSSKTNQRR